MRDRVRFSWRRKCATIRSLFGLVVGILAASSAFAGYITIPDAQRFNGSPLLVNDLHTSDLATRQYRLLEKQSDGFNGPSLSTKWFKTDIGGDATPAPTVPGGTLSLLGGGSDIASTTDRFTYLYQSNVGGNFTIDVRLNSMTNTNSLAKAGIMVRQSVAGNSRYASILMTPTSGVRFQSRSTNGGSTTVSSSATSVNAPRWLRLVRSGNSFTAFYSSDGRTWTQQGSARTITMTDPVMVGLAVTSRSTSVDCTAVFDNFLFTKTGQSGQVNTWNSTSAGTPASIVITNWADGDYALSVRDPADVVPPETNLFTWSSCVDGTPSTVTIPAGQTVKGKTVSLKTLYTTTGNPGNITYTVNGVSVLTPWNSTGYGTLAPEAVTLAVTAKDPDCGGRTFTVSQTITVDNTCTDATPSNLTVSTGQTVGGEAVDLASLYFKTGNVAGLTYYVNGTLVTTPWNSTSFGTSNPESVTFEVRGTDPDCGGSGFAASNLVDVDNTCVRAAPTITFDQDRKYVGPGRALQYTVTVHNNDSPYCGPSTFNLTLAGETNPTDFEASTLTGGSNMAIAGGGSAGAAMTVRAKATAPEWNRNIHTLRVTSSEASHGTVQDTAETWVFLVSPITHNSITTGSAKWGSKWGTSEAGSKYGNFTCLTCHDKGTGAVKWLRTTVSTPDGTNWGNGSAKDLPFVFPDARQGDWWGNDDPNNDLSGRTSSNRICEVCHSTTLYHRYDTNIDPDGAGPLTPQTEKRHFNGRVCIDCHRHSDGFTAGCDFCHGNPPLGATPGPNGLAKIPGTTGSATMGTHFRHVKVLAFQCTYCHSTYRSPNTMPNTGPNGKANIDISFKVFGLTDLAATAGSYSGQDGVSYNGTVVPAGEGDLTCSNVYCHGSTIGGTDAQWNSNVSCNACHGTSAASPPPGKSHDTHVARLGIGCSDCHGSTPVPGSLGHVNGRVKWDVAALARHKGTGPAVTYRGAASGETAGLAPSAVYGSCVNVACHYGRTTPPWNNGGNPATCTTCHNDGSDSGVLTDSAPNTGAHADHMDPAKLMVSKWVNRCESCHGPGANTAEHAGHLNFAVEFADGFTYTTGSPGSCTNYCHGPESLNSWSTTATLACHGCHAAPYLGPTVVDPGGAGNGMPASGYGSHLKAVKTETFGSGTDWDAQCKKCHPYHSGGVTVPLPPTSWDNPGITSASEPFDMRERLGINYTITDGIHLGGTVASGASEAQICWGCHDNAANGVSEWGTNGVSLTRTGTITGITKASPASVTSTAHGLTTGDTVTLTVAGMTQLNGWSGQITVTGANTFTLNGVNSTAYGTFTSGSWTWNFQYDYGTLSASDWTTATWTSAVGIFGYKTAAVQSTHGAGMTTGVQGKDAVGNIRCSYCHDLHDMNKAITGYYADGSPINETQLGKPYLRGSWRGNPYKEDGAPQSGTAYTSYSATNAQGSTSYWGAVPRASANPGQRMGGFWIDQNSANPTGAWTAEQFGGLCEMCHGDGDGTFTPAEIGGLNYFGTQGAGWVSGYNGHANSVKGGPGPGTGAELTARNIFAGRGGTTSYGNNPYQHFDGMVEPADNGSWGFRTQNSNGARYQPYLTGPSSDPDRPWLYNRDEWGVDERGTTTQANYHQFSCSKCHNPHASRLPALMITNCLDTKRNTWDNSYQVNTRGTSGTNNSYNRSISNWSSAQNCHRLGGNDPSDTRDTAADTAVGGNKGWNTVTPW